MKRRQLLLALAALFCSLPGCVGGGTDGTGGIGLLVLEGLLLDRGGVPVANASVGVEGTQNRTTTGQDGRFALKTPADGKEIELEVSGLHAKGKVRISGVPQGQKNVSISLKIIFDPESGSLEFEQNANINGDIILEGGELSINNIRITPGTVKGKLSVRQYVGPGAQKD